MAAQSTPIAGDAGLHAAAQPDVAAYHRLWRSKGAQPTFLLGADFRLIWSNAAFTALDVHSPVRQHQQSLQFSDRALHAGFVIFLAGLAAEPLAWLLQDDERGVLLLRCVRLQPDDQEPAVACVLYDSRNRSSFVWADFTTVFALTSAEATLARRLAEGDLLTDVAASLSITYETAKTHLRRIYAKLGVSGREEFYAKMLSFRVV